MHNIPHEVAEVVAAAIRDHTDGTSINMSGCVFVCHAQSHVGVRPAIDHLFTKLVSAGVALERKRIASFLAENAADIAASADNACQNAATAYRDAKIALEKALAEHERVQAAAVIQEEHADNLRKLAASLDP